jgi:hypothetical protein
MRPVNRGALPVRADGTSYDFKKHTEARDHLIDRIGDYCSYCENILSSDADVEHVQPKTVQGGRPDLALSWENFLLACKYCNRAKWQTIVALDDCFWPDRDNSFRAFVYEHNNVPKPDGRLPGREFAIAQRTLGLTGLDRVPGHPDFSHRDRRFLKRKEAWGVAILTLQQYRAKTTSPASVLLTAVSRGFFSIWMAVFSEHAEILRLLIAGFKAADDCFDADGAPVARPGGLLLRAANAGCFPHPMIRI